MVEYSNLQHLYTSKKSRAGTTDIRNGEKKKKSIHVWAVFHNVLLLSFASSLRGVEIH